MNFLLLMRRWRVRPAVVACLLLALSFLVVFWETILVAKKPGEQGVYWSRFFGGTSDAILGEGTHLKFPWDVIAIYSTRLQTVSQTTSLLTRDGMEVEIGWVANFRLVPQKIPEMHRMVGPGYIDILVVPQVVSALRVIIGNHTAEEVYMLPEHKLLAEIDRRMHVQNVFAGRIADDRLLMSHVSLPSSMSKAIIDKLMNEQTMLAFRFRLKAEDDERERKAIEARGIRAFESISGISILKWRGIEATRELASSPNAKIIVTGADRNALPVLLNVDDQKGVALSADPVRTSSPPPK